jgi:hypothetical protein
MLVLGGCHSCVQFDGLGMTADVINGIFALADRVGSKPAVTEVR